jgi:hypothetical protein
MLPSDNKIPKPLNLTNATDPVKIPQQTHIHKETHKEDPVKSVCIEHVADLHEAICSILLLRIEYPQSSRMVFDHYTSKILHFGIFVVKRAQRCWVKITLDAWKRFLCSTLSAIETRIECN